MDEISIAAEKFQIFDHMPVGVCVLRSDFIVLYWNNCLEDWTGIDRGKIIGSNIIDRFSHLNNPKYLNRIQTIFEGGPPTIFSSQLHKYIFPSSTREGSLRVQHTTVIPVRSPGDDGFYALFVLEDVTDLTNRIKGYRGMRDQLSEELKERKRIENELRRTQEELELRVRERTSDLVSVNKQLQQEINERIRIGEELKKLITAMNTLVDHLPEGVILLDAENQIVLANHIGRKYLDILSGGKTYDKLTHISVHPLEDLLVSSPNITWHEVRVENPSESVFAVAGRPIMQGPVVTGSVLVLRDTTEEHILEEKMQSQERLAAVGQMAAGIAHDFNNILTGMIGFADILLAESSMNEGDKQMVEAILENGLRAAQLISQILDFSRRSISQMVPFDLMPFLKDFIKFIRRTIPENIHITIDFEPAKYVMRGDPAKIQQVLANLAVNARDSMQNGGELNFMLSRVQLTHIDKPPLPDMPEGEWIVLKISDTGTGIPPDTLPYIFEPFFTTKEVGKGTGLGLSQVYGIIKQHEAFIDVKTEIGSGSAFIIYLPAISETTGIADSYKEPLLLKEGGETILVVEDNEPVLNFIHRKLGKLGFKVIGAGNGKDALSIFEKHSYEIKLVITDLVMPEMGGVELCKALKAKNPFVKVIALSGYPIGSETEELARMGISAYLQKPFQGESLIKTVYKALEKA